MKPRPLIAVAGLAFDDDGRILLIQRGRPPGQGQWTIPGGRVEWGEQLVDACKREFHEETGLEVEVGPMVTIVERMSPPGVEGLDSYHYVIIDYLITATSGQLAAASDAVDARWLQLDELISLDLTEGLEPVIVHSAKLIQTQS